MNLWTVCQHPIAQREMYQNFIAAVKCIKYPWHKWHITLSHSISGTLSSLTYFHSTLLLLWLWFYATIRLCVVWKYLTFTVVGILQTTLRLNCDTLLRVFINNDVRLMWRCSLSSPAVPGPWRWSEDGWMVTSVTSLSRSQGGLHLGLSRVGLAPAPTPCYCNNCRPESSESGRARDQSGRLTRRYRGAGDIRHIYWLDLF